MRKIIFASHNTGKIRELRELLDPFQLEIIPQAELGVSAAPETACTFVENALLKARHACWETGLPAIADDSGLIVDALKGEPGIRSARYAGENATASDNIEKLLVALQDVPDEKRSAYFYCVLVCITHAEDPTPLICEGRWYGKILVTPTGKEGFGYDPVVFDSEKKASAAELSLNQKNQISHRGKALQLLLKELPAKLGITRIQNLGIDYIYKLDL